MKRSFAILTMVAFAIGLMTFSSCKKDDTTAPTITLTGGEVVYINLGTTFTEPGFIANDDKDGDITANVTATAASSVNTSLVDHYILTYSVSDKAGNSTTVIRDVYVKTAKLAGNYHVHDTISGITGGPYDYDVVVDSSGAIGTWWQSIVLKNFGGFSPPGKIVSVIATISGNVITIAEQSPANMDFPAKISGTGTYNGTTKTLLTFTYMATYLDGSYVDNGIAKYTKF